MFITTIRRIDSSKHGFTLIELSIVLVIIGLIVGGVLVGQDLIAAAAVRAQVSQIEKYNTAVNTFYGKYSYLPGDIPEPYAGQFGLDKDLGGSRDGGPGCADGNGLIQAPSFGGLSGVMQGAGETGQFWNDLSIAGLVDGYFHSSNAGIYQGVCYGSDAGVIAAAPSLYLPTAKIGNNNYIYVWSGGYNAMIRQPGDPINYYTISQVSTNYACPPAGPSGATFNTLPGMSIIQAYNIDKKIDDGLPQSGRVLALYLCGDDGSSYGNQAFVYWAGGGANTGPGGGTVPINSSSGTTCFDSSSGQVAYSTSSPSPSSINCALSFQFQ